MGKKYSQFTIEERIQLATLNEMNLEVAEIAIKLGKHKSSIYREQLRNRYRNSYQAHNAQKHYLKRRDKTSRLQDNIVLQNQVIDLLKQHYSPDQISITLAKKEQVSISHESIYQFVYSAYGKKLNLSPWLPRQRKQRKARAKSQVKHSPIPNRNPIANRPQEINDRSSFGHFEADLMIFSNTKTNLITLCERESRCFFAIKNPSKHANVTADNIIASCRGSIKAFIGSMTFDNGGEFARHELIAKKLNLNTYFCEPYSSWQKGSVEQRNGVMRIEMPRDIDIDNMSQKCINKIVRNINNRPMRLHSNQSPADIFKKYAGDNLKGFVALQV